MSIDEITELINKFGEVLVLFWRRYVVTPTPQPADILFPNLTILSKTNYRFAILSLFSVALINSVV